MLTDRYIKIVLTVIAACLLFNILRDATSIRQAFAQPDQTHVIIDQVASYAFQYAGPMAVTCTSGCKDN